jgi:adenylyltransferase/sulfurtransferase
MWLWMDQIILATRYLSNDIALENPVYGSILGFEGQISCFNHKGSKTYEIYFKSLPIQKMFQFEWRAGHLPGMIGTMMAHETLN